MFRGVYEVLDVQTVTKREVIYAIGFAIGGIYLMREVLG
jgi:hypothetical protein